MNPVTWIAVAAIVLSLLTFVATQFGTKRTATASYVNQLETRIYHLETALTTANARVVELEAENLRLMKRILRET